MDSDAVIGFSIIGIICGLLFFGLLWSMWNITPTYQTKEWNQTGQSGTRFFIQVTVVFVLIAGVIIMVAVAKS